MLEYLNKTSLFYIVPERIEHTGVFSPDKIEKETIILASQKNVNFSCGEYIEGFVNSTEGIIYFQSKIKDVQNNSLIIEFPQDYEILQRRENKRIKINSPVTIKKDNTEMIVTLYDISAGGIKILTETQLLLETEYEVILNLDNIPTTFIFVPKRISVSEEGTEYNVSGQIISKSPKDKITLVQYCYKKLFEQSNRK